MDEQTHIGRIERVSPGNRMIRIEMAKSYVAYAMTLPVLRCEQKDGSILRCRVETARPSKEGLAVTMVAGVPRDTIAQLKNNRIVVPSDEVLRDCKNYDVDELVGLKVYTPNKTQVGTVTGAFDTQANGMAEVLLSNDAQVLLPIVPEIVARVDWTSNALHLSSEAPIEAAMHQDNDDTVDA
jgi:ribosomal 30S subunit maturation factor RimM